MKTTKNYLMDICRNIRKSYVLGDRLNESDERWLIDNIFIHHDNWPKKSDNMDYIYVDRNIYNTVSFWIHYKDGHNDDISFINCIRNI